MMSMLVPNTFCEVQEDSATTRMASPQTVSEKSPPESVPDEVVTWEFDDDVNNCLILYSGTTVFVQLSTGSVHRRTEAEIPSAQALFKAEENAPIIQLLLCRDESCLCTVIAKRDNQRGDWSHLLSRFDLNSDMRTPNAELHISTAGVPSFCVTNAEILVTLDERSYPNRRYHTVQSMATFDWEQCRSGNTDIVQVGKKVKARRESRANAVEAGEVVEVDTESKKFKIRFADGETGEAGEIDSIPAGRIIQDVKAAPKPRRKWTVCDPHSQLQVFDSCTPVALPGVGAVAIGWVYFKHNDVHLREVELVSLPVINFPQRIGAKISNVISLHLSSDARMGVMHLLGETQLESLEGIGKTQKETLVQVEFTKRGIDSGSSKRWSFDSTTPLQVQRVSTGGEILAITKQTQLQLAIGGRAPVTVFSCSGDILLTHSCCLQGSHVATCSNNIIRVHRGRESGGHAMEWKVEDDRKVVDYEMENQWLAVVTERLNFGCETATEGPVESYQQCDRRLTLFRIEPGTSTLQPSVVHPLEREVGFNFQGLASNGTVLLSNEDGNALTVLHQNGASLVERVRLRPRPSPKIVSAFRLSSNGARVLGITDEKGTCRLLAFNIAGGKSSVTEPEIITEPETKWDLEAGGWIECVSGDGRTVVVGGSSADGTVAVFTEANKKDGTTFANELECRLSYCGKRIATATKQRISVFDVFTRNIQASYDIEGLRGDFTTKFDFFLSTSNPNCLALVVAMEEYSKVHKISLPEDSKSPRENLLSCERLRLDKFGAHVACENLSTLGLAEHGSSTCSLWTMRDANDTKPFDAKEDRKREIVLDSPLTGMAGPIKFSGSGATVVLACQDQTIRVHDSATLAEWGRFSHVGDIVKYQISQDGSKLMIHSYDRTARLFDIAEKRVLRTWEGFRSESADLSADLSVLMTIQSEERGVSTPILHTFQGSSLPSANSSFDSVLSIKPDSISKSDSAWLVAPELWLPLVGALPALHTLLYALLCGELDEDKLAEKAWGHIVGKCPTLPWAHDAFSRSPTEIVLQGLDGPRLNKEKGASNIVVALNNARTEDKLLLAVLDCLLGRTIEMIAEDPDRRAGFICAGGPDSTARCIAWLVKNNQVTALTRTSLSGSYHFYGRGRRIPAKATVYDHLSCW